MAPPSILRYIRQRTYFKSDDYTSIAPSPTVDKTKEIAIKRLERIKEEPTKEEEKNEDRNIKLYQGRI